MAEFGSKWSISWSLAVISLAVASRMWAAFALSLMWGWFVVPLGVGPISAWHAFGLTVMVSLLRTDLDKHEDQTPLTRLSQIAVFAGLIVPFCLFLAWLAKGSI